MTPRPGTSFCCLPESVIKRLSGVIALTTIFGMVPVPADAALQSIAVTFMGGLALSSTLNLIAPRIHLGVRSWTHQHFRKSVVGTIRR